MSDWRDQVWCGWRHVQEPITDPAVWHSQQFLQRTDIKSFRWDALKVIHSMQPTLLDPYSNLSSGRAPVDVSKNSAEQLMAAIKGGVGWDSHYFRCRVIQVLEVGNHLGLFRVERPAIPIPSLKKRPSPYHYPSFHSYLGRIPQLRTDFVGSLATVDPSGDDSYWGQMFLSAMLFGGLVETRRVVAIPDAVKTKATDDPLYWLDLPRERNERGVRHNPTHRWVVDPLTRLLLIRSRGRSAQHLMSKGGQKSVRLKRAINSYLSLIPGMPHQVKDLREFQYQIDIGHQTRMPGYLAAYLRQSRSSYTLKNSSWERLISPTRMMDYSLLMRSDGVGRHGTGRVVETILSDISDQLPVHHADYLSLIDCIKNATGSVGLSVDGWRAARKTTNQTIKLLADWVIHWLTIGGAHQKRPFGRIAVLRRIEQVGSRLVAALGNENPLTLTPEDHLEYFQMILEDCDDASVRGYIASGLLSWHCFLTIKHQVTEIDRSSLREIVAELAAVDVNIVTPNEFRQAEQWVYTDSLQQYGKQLWSESLAMVMVCGFYLGLRRSEVVGLQVNDVEGIEDLCLYVRPNDRRSLKTKSAKRRIPASTLIPNDYLKRFKAWTQMRRKEVEDERQEGSDIFLIGSAPIQVKRHLLFPEFEESSRCKSGFKMIHEALHRSTHDTSIRFHHLRHAFANWTLLRFSLYELMNSGVSLPGWFLLNPVDWSELVRMVRSIREEILGRAPCNRRSLIQITQLLGHASTAITVRTYLHNLDIVSALYCRRFSPTLSEKDLDAIGITIPRSFWSGDDVDEGNALDRISDHILSESHDRKAKTRVVRLREKPKVEAKLQTISKALWLLEEGVSVGEVSKRIGVQERRILLWKERVNSSRFCKEISDQGLLKNRHYPLNHVIQLLPRGDEQNSIAEMVSMKIENLKSEGDPPRLKKQAATNRINKSLNLLMKQWIPGTALTVEVHKISDVKTWLWFLERLGLDVDLDIRFQVNQDSAYSPNRQYAYWTNGIGDRYNVQKSSDSADGKNGGLKVRVPSHAINSDSKDRTSKTLEAVRLSLVAEWIDS